jgi:hypothetical protein
MVRGNDTTIKQSDRKMATAGEETKRTGRAMGREGQRRICIVIFFPIIL